MRIIKKGTKAKQKNIIKDLVIAFSADLKNEKFLNGDKMVKSNDLLESIVGFVLKGPRVTTQFMLFPVSRVPHRIGGIMASKGCRDGL